MSKTSAKIKWRRFLFLIIFLSLLPFLSRSQTIFWSDNFDAPSGGTNNNNAGAGWSLNVGSSPGQGNQWFINTPSNTGCGAGNSIHISCNDFLCQFLGGPDDAIYNAAAEVTDLFSSSPNISTVGQTNITLKFSYVGVGQSNQDYGLLRLSGDGGATWTDMPTKYQLKYNCTQESITLPANYEGKTNFRIGFRWINNADNQGSDPSFAIDDIQLSVASGPSCSAPIASAGNATSVCTGGSTTIGGSPTASGGSGGAYTYSWSPSAGLNNSSIANPSASPAATTTYTVTVSTGSGCSATNSVVVTVGSTAQAGTVTANRDTICSGTVASLNVTGNSSPIQWQSSPDGSTFTDISGSTDANCLQIITQTTWYRVVAGSGACTATSNPYKIVSAESPVGSFYVKSQTGNQITFSADSSIGATAYNWNFGDTPNPGEVQSTSANPVHTYDSVKTYHVCLTVLNGSNCSFTICKDISTAVGIQTLSSNGEWKVYPVPFSDNLIIMRGENSKPVYEIEIYDLPGRMVFSRNYLNTGHDSYMIDLTGLPSGMYYVKIKTGDSNFIRPVIKQ